MPAVETERVGLAEDDATLMWKVFDYASLSATPNKRPRLDVDTSISGKNEAAYPMAAPETTNRPTFKTTLNPGAHVPVSTLGYQNFSRPEDNLDLSMFDQLPEDWAFTIDDWTLFGAPGSTYLQ